ncbi:MAG: rane protein [Chitinophagaceae bacterium]|nr:rane protein [Chitinophagaceae bacterium]
MSTTTKASSTYFPGIDWLKGMLILGVVFVHTLSGSMLEHILYAFLMPVFIFITGFLLKEEYVENVPYRKFIAKYTQRMIIPWLIASVIYLLINALILDAIVWNAMTLVNFFLYPFYHLWFIPGLLIMMSLLWLVVNRRFNFTLVLVSSLFLSIAWFSYLKHWHLDQTILYWLGDKRFYIYFFFYALGFYIRNNPAIDFYKRVPLIVSLAAIAFGCLRSVGFIHKLIPSSTSGFFFISLNFGIITLCLNRVIRSEKFNTRFTDFCSKQSLAIYLYHYVPLLLLQEPVTVFVSNSGLPASVRPYLIAVILFGTACLTVLPSIALLARVEKINQWFFGNTAR